MVQALTVLFEDDQFIAIDKPAGMLVHRSKLDSGERVFAVQTLRDQVGFHVYPVHRLDKPTSGVLLFGKNAPSARLLSKIFQDQKIRKTYTMVVRGWTEVEATIDYALRERLDKTTDSLADIDKPAQSAVTHYKTMTQVELSTPVGRYDTARYSLVHAWPETGRKHQLRRHFKHIFHPIIGDRKYGDRDHNLFWKSADVSRLLLAATSVSFDHPLSGERVEIGAPTGFPGQILDLFDHSAGGNVLRSADSPLRTIKSGDTM